MILSMFVFRRLHLHCPADVLWVIVGGMSGIAGMRSFDKLKDIQTGWSKAEKQVHTPEFRLPR